MSNSEQKFLCLLIIWFDFLHNPKATHFCTHDSDLRMFLLRFQFSLYCLIVRPETAAHHHHHRSIFYGIVNVYNNTYAHTICHWNSPIWNYLLAYYFDGLRKTSKKTTTIATIYFPCKKNCGKRSSSTTADFQSSSYAFRHKNCVNFFLVFLEIDSAVWAIKMNL